MIEFSKNNPEKKEIVNDNDQKFTLETIDPQFLTSHNALSYLLVTDWLETNEADETKVAYKKFDDGSVKILHIAKVTIDGNRTAEKRELTEVEYEKYRNFTKIHVEKRRYEFDYVQEDGSSFAVKYDEFIDSSLRVLEVGAKVSSNEASFKSEDFPYELKDVSNDDSFIGFRVATHIS